MAGSVHHVMDALAMTGAGCSIHLQADVDAVEELRGPQHAERAHEVRLAGREENELVHLVDVLPLLDAKAASATQGTSLLHGCVAVALDDAEMLPNLPPLGCQAGELLFDDRRLCLQALTDPDEQRAKERIRALTFRMATVLRHVRYLAASFLSHLVVLLDGRLHALGKDVLTLHLYHDVLIATAMPVFLH
eukprot:CAMPEP_0180786682 /NCGR_PEP_ID=MMETSP1038_2-20121128/50939_1 /TAXON_ID=632150 /ORGANISM="Azadinium spinosum, Strain 3D9" /LENGTH=190 /DNA_ID=CAMNT_0022823837 /DNA_START=350 /DNA_END=922 /DNA_ORIENTATION=-